ncbi:hypothetical protein HDU76_007073, partial [Blyttiomyces sp. JEL0837]
LRTAPQKVICEKYPSKNNHPTSSTTPDQQFVTPSVFSSDSIPPGRDQNPWSTITILHVVTESDPAPTSTNLPTANYQTSSNSKVIAAVTVSSIGSLLIIFALAWYIRRRENRKVNELVGDKEATSGNENEIRVESDTSLPVVLSSASPDVGLEAEASATVQWLTELHPTIQQSLMAKHSDSATNINAEVDSSSPTSKNIDTTLHRNLPPQSQSVDEKFTQEIEPSMQRFIHSEIISEGAPTSNINLENHLQRVYGSYRLWTNEFVMEWARLKRLDSAVVEILRNYRIDGPLLATLDVHSLKEKCDVQDFRLRAKFMQAVEFLKDSHQVINNSATVSVSQGEGLPQYEDATNGTA